MCTCRQTTPSTCLREGRPTILPGLLGLLPFQRLFIAGALLLMTFTLDAGEFFRRWSNPLGASLVPSLPAHALPLIVDPVSGEVLINGNRYVRLNLAGDQTESPSIDGSFIGLDAHSQLVTYKMSALPNPQVMGFKFSVQRFFPSGTPAGPVRVVPFPDGFKRLLRAALDRQGNLILVTQSTNAARPLIVSKLNPVGGLLWTRAEPWLDPVDRAGSTLPGSVLLGLDATGVIFLGATVQPSAIDSTYPAAAKLSPQGDLIWARSFQSLRSPGAVTSRLVELAPTLDGKLAMSIEEVVPRVLKPWPEAMEVTGLVTTHISPTGTPEWTRFFSSSEGHCNGGGLAVDREGNILVGGTLNVPRFSDPPGFTPVTDARLLLLSYSAGGVLRWGQPTGPQLGSLQVCNAVVGHAGDIYVLGTSLSKSSFSFQVSAYTGAGELRWSLPLSGAVSPIGFGLPPRDPLSARITVLRGGEILVSSIQGDLLSGWPDALTRVSPSGTIEWTRLISHLPEEAPLPTRVIADPQRNTYWFVPSATHASGWECRAYDDQGTRLWTSALETPGVMPGPLTDAASVQPRLVHVLQGIPPQKTNEGEAFRFVAPGFRLTALGMDGTISWSTTQEDPTLRETPGFTKNRVPLALAVDERGGSYVLSHLDEQTGGPTSSRFELHAYGPTGSAIYSNRLPAYAEGQGTNAHYATPQMMAADPTGHLLVGGIDVFFVPLESEAHVEGRYGALLLRYAPDGRLLWKQRVPLPKLPGKPSSFDDGTRIHVTVDSQGAAYLTSQRPNGDVATSTFSSSGEHLWTSTGQRLTLPLASAEDQKRWMTDARGTHHVIVDQPVDRQRLKAEGKLRDLDLRRAEQLERTVHLEGKDTSPLTVWWFGAGDVVTLADSHLTIGSIPTWTFSVQWLTDRSKISLHGGKATLEVLLDPETNYVIEQAAIPAGPWSPVKTATSDWLGDVQVLLELPDAAAGFFRVLPAAGLP